MSGWAGHSFATVVPATDVPIAPDHPCRCTRCGLEVVWSALQGEVFERCPAPPLELGAPPLPMVKVTMVGSGEVRLACSITTWVPR